MIQENLKRVCHASKRRLRGGCVLKVRVCRWADVEGISSVYVSVEV